MVITKEKKDHKKQVWGAISVRVVNHVNYVPCCGAS